MAKFDPKWPKIGGLEVLIRNFDQGFTPEVPHGPGWPGTASILSFYHKHCNFWTLFA